MKIIKFELVMAKRSFVTKNGHYNGLYLLNKKYIPYFSSCFSLFVMRGENSSTNIMRSDGTVLRYNPLQLEYVVKYDNASHYKQ